LQAPVPPGALPQEKADDVPAKLSQGEYVLPAEVVRWHGVKAIQDMMSAAQEGFGKLQQQGQIKSQQQMPPQSPNAGQGQPRPPMQQPPQQKPQMTAQPPPSPISGMADGGMVAQGLPPGLQVRQQQLPDGRIVHVYVDAAGNPVGQMGSQFLGGFQNSLQADASTAPVSPQAAVRAEQGKSAATNANNVVRYEGGDNPGSDPDHGGPTNDADDPNASPMDAVGAMASAIGKGLMGAVMGPIAEAEVKSGQFGAKMKGHISDDMIGAVEAAYGVSNVDGSPAADGKGVAGGGGVASMSTDGSPAGDGSGVAGGNVGAGPDTEGSPAGDGGGTAGGADAGSEGSGMGADPDGGEAYADGGMVCPPGLHMKAKSKPKGKPAPWLK
jgi:hypothetical protein